jgi:hypothetical protein
VPGGLELDQGILDPGPLAVRGQVHIDSGTNIATVIGLTPGAFASVTGPVYFGRDAATLGAPFFMNSTQATAGLNVFTSALKGLVPLSGGGTTNFMRADGTWAAPPNTFHVIKDNGSVRTTRSGLNFINTTSIAFTATDDSVGDETEITAQRAPLSGVITAAVNANTTTFTAIAADSFFANITTGVASPTTVAFATIDSTSIVYDATTHTFQLGAASGGDITRAQNSLTYTINSDAVTNAKAANMAPLTVKSNATNATTDPQDVAASVARHTFRVNAAINGLEWGYPCRIQVNSGAFTDAYSFNAVDGTHTTAAFTPTALGGATLAYSVNLSTLVAAIDSTSVVASGNTLERAALTGAIAAAQNSNATVFAGILNNAVATTDRTNLNFVGFTITDDSVNDRIVITAPSSSGHIIRDNGTNETARSALNFVTSANITAVCTDDSINNETEATFTVNQGATYAWTGTHDWTGTGFAVATTNLGMQGTNDVTLASVSGGLALGAGHVVVSPNVGNGDVCINATSGVSINADATTPVTGATLNCVELTAASDITVNAVSGIAVNAHSTVPITSVASGVVALLGETAIELRSAIKFTSVLSTTIAGTSLNNLAMSTSNVLLVNPTGAPTVSLTGMLGSGDDQVVLIVNVNATNSLRLVEESDATLGTASTATNRFSLRASTSQIIGPKGMTIAVYDRTADRWRALM